MTQERFKRLGEVCKMVKGKKPQLFKTQDENTLPYLGAKFMRGTKESEFASTYDKNSVLVLKKDLVIICDGSKSGDIFSGFEGILSSTMGRVDFDSDVIDSRYLKNFLDLNYKLFNGAKKGAAIPHLDFHVFNNIEIPLPPLLEQKRIVKILDEKLGKIKEAIKLREEAITETEKILSRSLSEIFEEGRKNGWDEKTFEEALSFKTGKLDSNAMVSNGRYPFFTCAQQTYAIDSYAYDQKAILLAGNNAAGKYSVKYYDGKFDAYQRTYIITPKNENHLDFLFLKNYIIFILNDLKDLSVGANTKFLTMKILNKIKMPLPPLIDQKQIVEKLDSLSGKIKQLNELQTSQLSDLKALEKTLLREAFNGEF